MLELCGCMQFMEPLSPMGAPRAQVACHPISARQYGSMVLLPTAPLASPPWYDYLGGGSWSPCSNLEYFCFMIVMGSLIALVLIFLLEMVLDCV